MKPLKELKAPFFAPNFPEADFHAVSLKSGAVHAVRELRVAAGSVLSSKYFQVDVSLTTVSDSEFCVSTFLEIMSSVSLPKSSA